MARAMKRREREKMMRTLFNGGEEAETEEMDVEECPVCYGPMWHEGADKALACKAGHAICTDCMRKLVKPCADTWTGLCYDCPLCRTSAALSPYHMMVMVKGDWTRAEESFDDREHALDWTERRVGFVPERRVRVARV